MKKNLTSPPQQFDPKFLLSTMITFKEGDFTTRLPENWEGVGGQIASTFNEIVKIVSDESAEIDHTHQLLCKEGNIEGRVTLPHLKGGWKKNVEYINEMIAGLVLPLNEISKVLSAVVEGNLSQNMPLKLNGSTLKGVFLSTAQTVNFMVNQLNSFVFEVTRVVREVGTEGKLGGQAGLDHMKGVWRDLTNNVNLMAANLTNQVRNIAEVTTAVATGDLTRKITVDVKGEILELKNTINTMVDQLSSFASEVTRVAREVGTEGKLGGQAKVHGMAGVWKNLTDNVNQMAANLTNQVRNIADVTTAVANGNLTKKITVDVKGEILELKNTINTMVGQLNSFAAEVIRVAREVGTDGKLGGQADVKGVAGTWKDLTENVNMMANNLTNQVRNIADVTTAVATGDLSKKITVDVKGEILDLKNTINTMVDQLNSFASEVTRVAREVGIEGKLGGQADVRGVAGVWKGLTENVNMMANNLTNQVRNIADVTTAVATGDLSKKITVDVKGEILDLKKTINTMVDQLNSFASEVTRVAREVGIEGKLGGQADVKGVAGVWKGLTENVNMMANNLTNQVRNIADVTTAVATGDLSKKITVDVKGEILDLKNTINTMVDQLNSFASEVTRVAREVGIEGKLGGQADVRDVAGIWKDLTENVNMMANNLTNQVRNIADVTTAVANGDLSKKITVVVKGEILDLKETINTMVDQLNSFASEVTRVAREVGTQGKLGGQADVKGVAGVWKDLTENVNMMGSNLTNQVRNIADVTTAVANGDLSKKITVDVRGEFLQLKDTINTMVDQLRAFASEVTRVAREVGTEGKLGGQAYVQGIGGTWKDLTDNVNQMASNLTAQVRNIAAVTTAVANGNLSKTITVSAQGEILELKNTVNIMVDQLSSFAAEVTRVAREVGTEGKLGGQAVVKGVGGIWKDLTDNVNQMAANLTDQVRGIAKVVTAVAQGDLKKKLTVQAKGEIAALSETINSMIDTLAAFAEQVTGVAREVGVEGRLGGQANVPGAAGTWKDLIDNVNQLAANLTTQVRAISDVATAVIKGDLSRSIGVEAQGEVAGLKNIINMMILNLKDTTLKNAEQDWLKTNLAKFTRILQGQKDLVQVAYLILSELAPMVASQQGLFYIVENIKNEILLRMIAAYAFKERKNLSNRVKIGEGLVGQCVYEKQRILLTQVPEDYIHITSGLGEKAPLNIVVLPILFEGQVKAIIELASFEMFSNTRLALLDQLTEIFGIVLNTIETNSRTEELLKQSQNMAHELQSQQEELQKTNDELEEKARLLAKQNSEVAQKNFEIEMARNALEEKAKQLGLTSKYKSEFLANMSHELRTPLNSLLILSQQLADNIEGNLTRKQIEIANTIHSAGDDLFALINDILDLSKIESGTVTLDIKTVNLKEICEEIEKIFRPVSDSKKLDFILEIVEGAPAFIETDAKRLLQILKNLLSNAFKFTEKGRVSLSISLADEIASKLIKVFQKEAIAISISDTGIGIPLNKQSIIFEAFQQVEASASRRYGGTGLGLSISRELAHLLKGEIYLESTVGIGSKFTLYLPLKYFEKPSSEVQTIDSLGFAYKARSFLLDFNKFADDRNFLNSEDLVILIIEDDLELAKVILKFVREKGFKGVVAENASAALSLASLYRFHSITLDINLNNRSGWQVLGQLREDSNTVDIPVHIITNREWYKQYLKNNSPLHSESTINEGLDIDDLLFKEFEQVLVIKHEPEQKKAIIELLNKQQNIHVVDSSTTLEALTQLQTKNFDCVVIDLELPGMYDSKLLDQFYKNSSYANIPVIIYAEKGLPEEQQQHLQKIENIIIVRNLNSLGKLLDVNNFLLQQKNADGKIKQKKSEISLPDLELSGKTVLIVDDDVRNIFAMTSSLEQHGIKILSTENGQDALKLLENNVNIDAILMDIMMPVMDGYEAIKEIRKKPGFKKMPIIALTAKAMKEDQEKCIEVGASEYISKPVDIKNLISVLKKWLCTSDKKR